MNIEVTHYSGTKPTRISKIEYCCEEMERCSGKYIYIYYEGRGGTHCCIPLPGREAFDIDLHQCEIKYCPFCRIKIRKTSRMIEQEYT